MEPITGSSEPQRTVVFEGNDDISTAEPQRTVVLEGDDDEPGDDEGLGKLESKVAQLKENWEQEIQAEGMLQRENERLKKELAAMDLKMATKARGYSKIFNTQQNKMKSIRSLERRYHYLKYGSYKEDSQELKWAVTIKHKIFKVMKTRDEKVSQLIKQEVASDKNLTLVYVDSYPDMERITNHLLNNKIPTRYLHEDITRDVELYISDFKTGLYPVLVGTAEAIRSVNLDGISISHIVNYDMPASVGEYLFRIDLNIPVGRVTSFFDTRRDVDLASGLSRLLVDIDQTSPPWLVTAAGGGGCGSGGGGEANGDGWQCSTSTCKYNNTAESLFCSGCKAAKPGPKSLD